MHNIFYMLSFCTAGNAVSGASLGYLFQLSELINFLSFVKRCGLQWVHEE